MTITFYQWQTILTTFCANWSFIFLLKSTQKFCPFKNFVSIFLELYEILYIPNKKCQIYTLCVYTHFYIVFIWYLLWVCKLKGQRTLILIKHGFLLCLVWEVFISSSWRFFLNCFPSVPYIFFWSKHCTHCRAWSNGPEIKSLILYQLSQLDASVILRLTI